MSGWIDLTDLVPYNCGATDWGPVTLYEDDCGNKITVS